MGSALRHAGVVLALGLWGCGTAPRDPSGEMVDEPRLSVLAEDGVPVAGVELLIDRHGSEALGTTNSAGMASLANVPTGAVVYLRPPSRYALRLVRRGSASTQTAELRIGGSAVVRVVDTAGVPCVSACVEGFFATNDPETVAYRRGFTDRAGWLRLDNLELGRWSVKAPLWKDWGDSEMSTIAVAEGAPSPLTLRVSRHEGRWVRAALVLPRGTELEDLEWLDESVGRWGALETVDATFYLCLADDEEHFDLHLRDTRFGLRYDPIRVYPSSAVREVRVGPSAKED